MTFSYRWRVGCGLALGLWLAGSAVAAQAQEPACRETTQTVMIGGRAERAISTACLQPDGTWRLAPQAAAAASAPPPGYVSQGYASPAPYGYAAPYAPAYYPPYASYPAYAPYYGGYGWGYPWFGGVGFGIGFRFGCCGWGHGFHGFHGGHGGFAHAGFHGGHHR